jgi:hypothetical protein
MGVTNKRGWTGSFNLFPLLYNLQPNPSSSTAEDSFLSDLRLLFYTIYIASRRIHRKYRFLYCWEDIFSTLLPSSRFTLLLRACLPVVP